MVSGRSRVVVKLAVGLLCGWCGFIMLMYARLSAEMQA